MAYVALSMGGSFGCFSGGLSCKRALFGAYSSTCLLGVVGSENF